VSVRRAWQAALAERAVALRAMARAAEKPERGVQALERAHAESLEGRWRRARVEALREGVRGARVVLVGDHRSLPTFTPLLDEIRQGFRPDPMFVAATRQVPGVRVDVLFDWRGPLEERLARAARRLSHFFDDVPFARVVVVAGELLTAPGAFPRALHRYGIGPDVILHRDPLPLYARLSAGLYRCGYDFATLEVPLLVQDGAFLALRRGEPRVLRPDRASLVRDFQNVVREIARAFGERCPRVARETPALLATDPLVVKVLGWLRPAHRALALDEIRHGESFFLRDEPRCVVLSTLGLGDAAEEAAHVLRWAIGGAEDPRRREDVLYARALHEAIGMAGALALGAPRADPDDALVHRMARGPGPVAEGARLAKAALGGGEVDAEGAPDAVLLAAAHLLGYRLGRRILRKRGALRELLRADLAAPGEARRRWAELAKR
jgi:hypothetical protein